LKMKITKLKIRFSENWDKLTHPGSFTTIRRFTPEKCEYYTRCIGVLFSVEVLGQYFYDAILKSVKIVDPKDLDPQLLEEDVKLNGKPSGDWYNRILNMKKVILLEFERVIKSGRLDIITDPTEFEDYLRRV